MTRSPLLVDLAGSQPGLDPLAQALEPPSDEDRLALSARLIQPDPGDLVPAAREVEERVPVAPGETHDALRPEHAARQPREEPLERLLTEGTRGAVDEAADAVGLEMIRRLPGERAVGRHAGGEEHVAVERPAHRREALGPRVELREPPPDRADLVQEHGDGLAPKALRQDVPEGRRLPAAEEAGEDVDGNRPHQTSGRPASPSGTGCPSRWSSVGATS